MFFYVDESGHTGNALFDSAQPTLYYGVLSCKLNLDLVAEGSLAALRKRLGVPRLHAADLGNARLASISRDLVKLHKKLGWVFDLYRIQKPDHAIICFFDQVFDAGMNKGVAWAHYWTPLRYMLLLKVAHLFDEPLAKVAWQARIETDSAKAIAGLLQVCEELIVRVPLLPDERSRQVITDALRWAISRPEDISYNVSDKEQIKQISPNIIGFQSVMHGIAARLLKADGAKASRIVVDRQSQFNGAQKTLSEFFAKAAGIKLPMGPGMPEANFDGMPTVPIECVAGTESAGLELVDIYLWTFKRIHEEKPIPGELRQLVNAQIQRGRTDEISLRGLRLRWSKWFANLPELEDMTTEQVDRAKKISEIQESRHRDAMAELPSPYVARSIEASQQQRPEASA